MKKIVVFDEDTRGLKRLERLLKFLKDNDFEVEFVGDEGLPVLGSSDEEVAGNFAFTQADYFITCNLKDYTKIQKEKSFKAKIIGIPQSAVKVDLLALDCISKALESTSRSQVINSEELISDSSKQISKTVMRLLGKGVDIKKIMKGIKKNGPYRTFSKEVSSRLGFSNCVKPGCSEGPIKPRYCSLH